MALLVVPALLHAVAASASALGDRQAAWRRAEFAALAGAAVGACLLAAVLSRGPVVLAGLRLDAPGAVVQLLVGFVGWIIVRFSHRYLLGEAGERRYLALMSGTLAAVSVVLMADHLLLLAAAWFATSLTLHRLLGFYAGRPAARLAAHKKFIAGRIADLSLPGAIALLGGAYGSLSLEAMRAAAADQGVPALAQAGLVLLALTALLKCAQMPLHGWLLQVMEAPTPVSALLHAGVVNLGGFVLIRFAPLLSQAPWAQGLLLVVAGATVVMATLSMGTRISIKVMLAWSTVAQMGFMLLQIALGLPAMALLHLVAHSLYKAHAFLSAGSVVQVRQALRLGPPAAVVPAWRWAAGAAVTISVLVAVLATGPASTPAAWLAGAVLGAALAPLVAAGRFALAAGVAAGWLSGHALASILVPPVAPAPVWAVAVAAVLLAALWTVHAGIALRPAAGWVRRLRPWAYGGFHLDERVSRWLLARWPLPADPGATVDRTTIDGMRA